MNGLLFPGQGSQSVGMGQALYEKLRAAKAKLDFANEILGYDLKKLMFEGPVEKLTNTEIAQPAIYTCSAMYLEKIKESGINFDFVAGHSLGEYTALLAAEVFNFSEGLMLVRRRGEAMSKMNGKGTMAAVMGLEESELLPFLNSSVVMANLNSRTQIVISGSEEGVNAVGKNLADREDIRFQKLQVSAAFHSSQMLEASDVMRDVIEQTKFNEPKCTVISNVTGMPAKNASEIKENLISQITGQVRWYDTIMYLKKVGVDMLYEVGSGEVLKKLNKTITFRPKCLEVEL